MLDISVIIPTYNREQYIERAIRSVIEQDDQGREYMIREVLIVDDGSVDDTETVVKGIDDNRINYIKLPVNGGAIAAWNKGIQMAESDWIAFQDSDDEWHRDKLIKQVLYLKEHNDCDMVSHPFEAFFSDGSSMCTRVVETDKMIEELAKSNFIGTPTMLIRKDALLKMGGFNPKIKALQDWDFVIRFADRYKIGMVGEVLLDVNMSVEGMSADAAKYYESRCRIISDNKEILLAHGCFDDAVRSLFEHAQNNGILDKVGKMLELYMR